MQLTDAIGDVTWSRESKGQHRGYFNGLLAGRNGNTAAIVLDSRGSERDSSGASAGISNAIDRQFLVELRNRSEMTITTGATVRAEGLHFPARGSIGVLSRQSDITVPKVSGSGNLIRLHWTREPDGHPATAAANGPLRVATDTQRLQSSETMQLESLRELRSLHFEAGLVSLSEFWRADFIQQLWVSHPEGLNPIELFPGATLSRIVALDWLVLSLLQHKTTSASL